MESQNNEATTGTNHVVYAFPRSEQEEVRFTIREYENRFYVDLRIWFRPPNNGKELHPTKKGLWIKPSQLPELEKGIRELSQAASELIPKTKPAISGDKNFNQFRSRQRTGDN